MSKMGIFLAEKRWVSTPSPSPKHSLPISLISHKTAQVVYAKENNEPVRGILLLLSIRVYYVRYIESNGIYNAIMVLIVGHIYG